MEVLRVFFAFIWLFFLPGFLVGWNLHAGRESLIDRLNFSFALSIALVTLSLFGLHLIGIRPVFWVVILLPLLIALGGWVFLWWRKKKEAFLLLAKWGQRVVSVVREALFLRDIKKTLVLVLLLLFSCYYWGASYTLWKDRHLLPEPDDAYTYVYSAKALKESPSVVTSFPGLPKRSSTNLTYFTYRYLLIGWQALTGQEWEQAFKFLFYVGSFVMIFAVLSFVRSFGRGFLDWFLGSLALLLFVGTGTYHGFYWVVPSFFALYFFLVLFRSLFWLHSWWAKGVLLGAFIMAHPLSFWLLGVFLLFAFLCMLFEKAFVKKQILRVLAFVGLGFVITVFFNLALFWRGADITYGYGPMKIIRNMPRASKILIKKEKSLSRGEQNFQQKSLGSWEVIKRDLFGVLFANYLVGSLFVLNLLWLFWRKRFGALSLGLALFVFVLGVSFYPYGYRSLLFLWPVLYLLVGLGVGELILFFTQAGLKVLELLAIAVFCFFAIINIFYRAFWSYYLRDRLNIKADKKRCAEFLLDHSDLSSRVGYWPVKEARSMLFAEGLYRRIFVERRREMDYLAVLRLKAAPVSREQRFFKDLLRHFLCVKSSEEKERVFILKIPSGFEKMASFEGCEVFVQK